MSAASARTAQALIRLLSPLAGEPRAQWLVARGYALVYLARYYIAAQYGKAVLGLFWVALAPLLLVAVYLPIFTFVWKASLPGRTPMDLALFFLAGLMAWAAVSDALGQGTSALIQHASIVRHAPTPPAMLPVVKVLGAFAGLGIGLGIAVVALLATGHGPGVKLLVLPVAYALLLLATTGMTLFLSATAAYLRDLVQALPTLLAVEFIAAPILYVPPDPAASLTGRVIQLNPLTPFLGLFRYSLLDWVQESPLPNLGLAALWTAFFLGLGVFVFRRLESGLGDVV